MIGNRFSHLLLTSRLEISSITGERESECEMNQRETYHQQEGFLEILESPVAQDEQYSLHHKLSLTFIS